MIEKPFKMSNWQKPQEGVIKGYVIFRGNWARRKWWKRVFWKPWVRYIEAYKE